MNILRRQTCKSVQYFLSYSGFKSSPSVSMTLYLKEFELTNRSARRVIDALLCVALISQAWMCSCCFISALRPAQRRVFGRRIIGNFCLWFSKVPNFTIQLCAAPRWRERHNFAFISFPSREPCFGFFIRCQDNFLQYQKNVPAFMRLGCRSCALYVGRSSCKVS